MAQLHYACTYGAPTEEQKYDWCVFKAEEQINLRCMLNLLNCVHGDPATPQRNEAVLPFRQFTEKSDLL